MAAKKDDRINEARWRELLRRFGGVAQFEETVSELANSLQTVSLLATRLRQDVGASSEDALQLEGAANRAVRVIRRLQPKQGRSIG